MAEFNIDESLEFYNSCSPYSLYWLYSCVVEGCSATIYACINNNNGLSAPCGLPITTKNFYRLYQISIIILLLYMCSVPSMKMPLTEYECLSGWIFIDCNYHFTKWSVKFVRSLDVHLSTILYIVKKIVDAW